VIDSICIYVFRTFASSLEDPACVSFPSVVDAVMDSVLADELGGLLTRKQKNSDRGALKKTHNATLQAEKT